MIGTDRYMAPEQLADGKITPATDVYACGVVADELLPGVALAASCSEIIDALPAARIPDERFADASELGEALADRRGQRRRRRRPPDQVAGPHQPRASPDNGRGHGPLAGADGRPAARPPALDRAWPRAWR